jgi:hypothetical protein
MSEPHDAGEPWIGHATARVHNDDPARFTSVSDSDHDAWLKAWRMSSEFSQKLGAARTLCDEFIGGDFAVAVAL